MRRLALALPALALSIAVAACDAAPPGRDGCQLGGVVGSRVVACVSGAREGDVAARAGRSGYGNSEYTYTVVGSGATSTTGGVDLAFFLPSGSDLAPGTYPVLPGLPPKAPDFVLDPARFQTADVFVFFPAGGGLPELWRAVAGKVTVEAVSGGDPAGRFRVTAQRDGQTIEVEGAFQVLG